MPRWPGSVARASRASGFVRREPLGGQTHVAFQARERAAVSAFHAAALAAGGMDNGLPGLRPDYHEQYFAAFTESEHGNNIEAVCPPTGVRHRASTPQRGRPAQELNRDESMGHAAV